MHEALRPHHESDAPIRDRTLWFGVGAGVVVWAIHFFISYVLVDQYCRNFWLRTPVLGIDGLHFATIALTFLGVIIVGAAALSSYRAWRMLDAKPERSLVEDRYGFMTFGGFALSLTFIVLMVVNYIPALIVPPCR